VFEEQNFLVKNEEGVWKGEIDGLFFGVVLVSQVFNEQKSPDVEFGSEE